MSPEVIYLHTLILNGEFTGAYFTEVFGYKPRIRIKFLRNGCVVFNFVHTKNSSWFHKAYTHEYLLESLFYTKPGDNHLYLQ
jgi:hypothetical protein